MLIVIMQLYSAVIMQSYDYILYSFSECNAGYVM